MGIQKLNKWIRMITHDQCVSWESLKGKRIGVDALGFLYKANEEHISDCLLIANLIAFWRSREIEPIFVFDGRIPLEKRGTCSRRKRIKDCLPEEKQIYVSPQDRNRVKQLLYASGVLFLNATEEADTVLALLMRKGDISAVVSQDLDFLARGCERLLVPSADCQEWREIRLSRILEKSCLTYDEFVSMCVLLGSDYCPSVPSLSLTTIANRIKREGLEPLLAREGIRNPSLWKRAYEILKGERDTWDSVLVEKQREKWGSPRVVETDVLVRMFTGDLVDFPQEDRCFLSFPLH